MLLASLLLSGCWDSRSLSDRAIILAILVTTAEHQGQLRWTFVMPNVTVTVSSLSSIAPQQQYFTVDADAPNLPTAVGAVQRQLSRDVYLGQLRVVAWSRNLTTEEALGLIEDLTKAPTVPTNFNTLVGESSLLSTFRSPQEAVPDVFLDKYLRCKECQPLALRMEGWQAWSTVVTPGVSLVVPAASRPTVIDHLVVYQRGQPHPAIMGPPETEGWAYLTGKAEKVALQLETPQGTVSLQNITAKTKSRVLRHGAAIQLEADIQARGVVASMRAPRGGVSDEQIRAAAAQAVLQRCIAAITWANRTRTDPFGFGRRLLWHGELTAAEAAAVPPIEADLRVTFVIRGEGEV